MNDFNITREELLNLAAQKLADAYQDEEGLDTFAKRLIKERIEEVFKTKLNASIEAFMKETMEDITNQPIVPVNAWGESTGKPTTIREQLLIKSRDFWETSVDNEGKPSGYGGSPRYQWLMKRVAMEEISKAVKANVDLIVVGFKEALTQDANKLLKEHIDKLITTPRPR